MSLFLLLLLSSVSAARLWKTTSYSSTALRCGAPHTILLSDAAFVTSCIPSPCSCTAGVAAACKTVTCGNFTTEPSIPTGMIGFTSYSDAGCTVSTIVRAAPSGCNNYGDGAAYALCDARNQQLSLVWYLNNSPTTCVPTGVSIDCKVTSNTCSAMPNAQCGNFGKNNCPAAPTTPPVSRGGAGVIVPLFSLLFLLVLAF